MSFVAAPGRVPGGYAQTIHISLWKTCGFPHDFPQNVDNLESLWITFSIQHPYHSKKGPGFQGLFGTAFFLQNAGYPQSGCSRGKGYPQYPVVCGKLRHKFSPGLAAFPSFSCQIVWNCAQRFFGEIFAGGLLHGKRVGLWISGQCPPPLPNAFVDFRDSVPAVRFSP